MNAPMMIEVPALIGDPELATLGIAGGKELESVPINPRFVAYMVSTNVSYEEEDYDGTYIKFSSGDEMTLLMDKDSLISYFNHHGFTIHQNV